MLDRIKSDLRKALLAKDGLKVATLRFLLAELKNLEIQKKSDLTDEDVIATIRHQIKQRKEAIDLYKKGNRQDLVDKEEQESEILSKYLPQEISAENLEKLVSQTIKESGATGPKDFGKVMGMVMAKIKGQADGSQVAELVRKLLLP